MPESDDDTERLRLAAREHLWSSLSAVIPALEDRPTIPVGAHGPHVRDPIGREHMDDISALEAMVVGHGRPELMLAAAKRMGRSPSSMYSATRPRLPSSWPSASPRRRWSSSAMRSTE